VPRKGFNRSKSENIKAKKADCNPENNTVGSELEMQLRKSIVPQRYPSPIKGKAAHQENTSNHHHRQLEFASPENHNSNGSQTSPTPDSTSTSSPASTPVSPINLQIPVAQAMVVNRMDVIIAARYAPFYEEQLVSFYSFADNFNVDYSDVWMRFFVQSLDGEVIKWFTSLPPTSIVDIEVLDEAS